MHFDTYEKQTLLEHQAVALARCAENLDFIRQLPDEVSYLRVNGQPHRGGYREVCLAPDGQTLEHLLKVFPPTPVALPVNGVPLHLEVEEGFPNVLPFWKDTSSLADALDFTWFSKIDQGIPVLMSVPACCPHSIPEGFEAITTLRGQVVYRRTARLPTTTALT